MSDFSIATSATRMAHHSLDIALVSDHMPTTNKQRHEAEATGRMSES